MNRPLLLLVFLFILFAETATPQATEVLGQQRLKDHVYFLASPELEGRGTGTAGQITAAEYIATAFGKAGLHPFHDSTFFQYFQLYKSKPERIVFKSATNTVIAWALVSDSMNIPDSSRLYYVGYGDRNLKPPQNENPFMVIRAKSLSQLKKSVIPLSAIGHTRYLVLMEHGPVTRAFGRKISADSQLRIQRIKEASWVTDLTQSMEHYTFAFMKMEQFLHLNAVSTSGLETWDQMIRKFNTGIPLDQYIACRFQPAALDSTGTENIIGLLEGSDRKNEFIVITAHYDHLGKDKGGYYPGADDNASGTAALIELAHALAEHTKTNGPLSRSILFVAFSAEELGLFGSEYFVRNLTSSEQQIMLNINMDMIGKSIPYNIIQTIGLQSEDFTEDTTHRESYVYILNKGKGTRTYVRYNKKYAKQYEGFRIERHPGFLTKMVYKQSSDHYHFYKAGIPVLVYFTGLHPEYHTYRDMPEKLDYGNMEKITRSLFRTVISVAEKDRSR